VDIEEHLAEHEKQIKSAAWHYVKYFTGCYNKDNADDIEQAITLRMIEAHGGGAYDHAEGELLEHGLWSYIKPALKQLALDALNPYLHYREKGREDYDAEQATRYGPLVEVLPTHDDNGGADLEVLQSKNRERGYGKDEARVTPINWYWSGHEEQPSTLTTAEQELADKLTANLTNEELEVLDASVGRSIHRAAEYLELPYATYYRRLRDARARAKALAVPLGLSSLLGG
jgi:DNA-directed RNA polymerase specialized sigma24 family protein